MPPTCSSCANYYQKGRGAGICALAGMNGSAIWKVPGETACKEYTADSPEVGKIKVVIPDLGGATLVVTDTVKSAELLGMVRPKGTKGYVVARCAGKGAGSGSHYGQAPPPLPINRPRLTQLMKDEAKLKELLREVRGEIRKEIEEVRKEVKLEAKL